MLQNIATPSEKEIEMNYSLKSWYIATITVVTLVLISVIPTPVHAIGLQHKSFLDREIECLARNIYFEAGGETFEGKVAVAQVTINRSEDEKFPSTICNVVHQKTLISNRFICQFSWVCNKKDVKMNKSLYAESVEVAELVLLEGFRLAKLKDAMYFHAIHIKPNWGKIKVARIGNHIFYRDRS